MLCRYWALLLLREIVPMKLWPEVNTSSPVIILRFRILVNKVRFARNSSSILNGGGTHKKNRIGLNYCPCVYACTFCKKEHSN